MADTWGASGAQYIQQCYDDYERQQRGLGAAMVLRALARAYEVTA